MRRLLPNTLSRAILTAVLLVGTALSAMAYTIEVDGIYYNCIAANTLSVTYKDEGFNSYSGDIVIPSAVTIRNHLYAVTTIDSCAFKNCTGLTSVTIPYCLTTIREHAFEGCTSLTDVVLPEPLTSIGIHAFSKCSSLTSIEIPDNVTMLGGYAFSECSSLTTVKLSNKLNAINDHTFYICRKLTSIVIPNQVSSIGYAAFQSCSSMTSVVIGTGVSKLEDKAFRGCYALKDITCKRDAPPTWNGFDCFAEVNYTDATLHVRRLRLDAYREATGWKKFKHINEIPYEHEDNGVYFIQTKWSGWTEYGVSFKDYNYNSYKGEVNIPGVTGNSSPAPHVVMILHDAFRDCDSLTSVSMGGYVHTIEERAFLNCPMLTSLNLSNQITTINDSAFAGCSALTSFTLPNSIKTIGHDVFAGCTAVETLSIPESVSNFTVDNLVMAGMTSLQAINCYSLMPPMVTGECFTPEQMSEVTLYVRPSSLLDFKLDPYWGRFAHIKAWTFDFQANGIYYLITSPTECAVSRHAPEGGSYSASSVTVPDQVTYEGDTYTVTAVGRGAFMNCPSLKSVTLPQTVTTIGQQAFMNSGLTGITFPTKVNTIDKQAFAGCSKISSLAIPNHIYAIEDSAFYDCHGLTSLDLGKSVTFISNYAFAGCFNLPQVFVPSSVEALCAGAFQDCTNLKSVTFDMNFEAISIDGDVFKDCYNLSTITSLALTPPELDNGHGGLSTELMEKATLMVPHSSVEAYQGADVWSEFSTIKPLNYDFLAENIYYRITGENTVGVVNSGYTNCYSGEVVVPSKTYLYDEEKKVTSVEPLAFAYNTSLWKVTLPNSVKEIGWGAFGRSSVWEVTLPQNITEIKNATFFDCQELKSITIPDKVTAIGDSAFFFCVELGNVVLPEGLKTIGNVAFVGIGFAGSANINLPNSLTKLGQGAFLASGIQELTLPASLDTIPVSAFEMCINLTKVTIPNSIKAIEGGAFVNCSQLKSVTIPNSVKMIDYAAFALCTSLDTVIIGSGVEKLGEGAFTNLNESDWEFFNHIDWPEWMREIMEDWIDQITHPLKQVTCLATTPPEMTTDAFNDRTYNQAMLTVPQGSVQRYHEDNYWRKFKHINNSHLNDTNGDGEVNIADVNCVLNAIMNGIDENTSSRMDTNGDGEVNIADINAILDEILQGNIQPL